MNENDPIIYKTRSTSLVPSVGSQYQVIDEGNVSPRFIRYTTRCVPDTPELDSRSHLCMGMIVQPFAIIPSNETQIQTVDFGSEGPIRCTRCMAYLNPNFKFVKGGHLYLCNLCGMHNDVPSSYYMTLDGNNIRRDKYDRPELCNGSIDYLVNIPKFNIKPQTESIYIFCLDVSYLSVVTGYLSTTVHSIKTCLTYLSQYPSLKINIMTFDSVLHFYLPSNHSPSTPNIYTVPDLDNLLSIAPSFDILLTISEPHTLEYLHNLLDLIIEKYQNTEEQTSSCYSAIASCYKILEDIGGKVLVYTVHRPSLGPGNISPPSAFNSQDEKNRQSSIYFNNPLYIQLAKDCATHRISIDLFVASHEEINCLILRSFTLYTGGQDIVRNICRETVRDVIMTVRTSIGLKVNEYYGHFLQEGPEIHCATFDSDKSFAVRFSHDGLFAEEQNEAFFQVAILYTSMTGDRKIRIHNLTLPIESKVARIFRKSDIDCIMNLSLKQSLTSLSNLNTLHQNISQSCIDILSVYRQECAAPNTPSQQLVLPESLKYLPLYTLCMVKNSLFSSSTTSLDEIAFLFDYILTMPVSLSLVYIYHHLYSLHDMTEEMCQPTPFIYPDLLSTSISSIKSQGIYLLDTGRNLYLFIDADVPQKIFNEIVFYSVETNNLQLCPPTVDLSQTLSHLSLFIDRIHLLLKVLSDRPWAPSIIIITTNPQLTNFYQLLLEDGIELENNTKNINISKLSYVAFLQYVHQGITHRTI